MKSWSVALLLIFTSASSYAAEVKIPKGYYKPVFKDPGETDSVVGPLAMDQTPVTNREFQQFISNNPQYSKSKVVRLFADTGYLSQWNNDTGYSPAEANFPVVNVSWFIARKYCEARGQRLPTIAEWEFASDAQSPAYEKQILEWYGKADIPLRSVGKGLANKFGVKDAHGLIWEWVENFSESIMSGDSRGGSPTESMFCGGAALKAKDSKLYATFMRFAFRSSLNAKYTSTNLGFRCVRDLKGISK